MTFSKIRCRWAVALRCGHDALATDAAYYGGYVVCAVCSRVEGRITQRPVYYRWHLSDPGAFDG